MATTQADEYRDEESRYKITKVGSIYQPPKDMVPRYRDGKPTKECAEFVNGELQRLGINSWGHAYQIPSQGEVVFGGYADLPKPQIIDKSNVLAYQHQAADRVKASDFDKLDPSQVYIAAMYYNKSPNVVGYYNAAQNEKRKNDASNTHVGLVYYDGRRWRVAHNIHGTIHDEPVSVNLGGGQRNYGITGVYTTAEPLKQKSARDGINNTIESTQGRSNRMVKRSKGEVNHPIKSKGTKLLRQFKKYFMQSGGMIPICGWDE